LKISKKLLNILIIFLCGFILGISLAERFTIHEYAKNRAIIKWTAIYSISIIISILILSLFWWYFSLLMSRLAKIEHARVLPYDAYSFLPLIFMIFTLFQKSYFLSLRFFKDNNNLLIIVSIIGVLYLKYKYMRKFLHQSTSSLLNSCLESVKSYFTRIFIVGKNWKLHFFLLTFFIYLLLASGFITQVGHLSGDEPHYLVLTHSILKDHDLEVSNNYSQKDYFPYYSSELEPSAHRGKKSGSELYSNHPPGFSLYLLPFYYLGKMLGGGWFLFILRASVVLIAALLSIAIIDFLREYIEDRRVILFAWLAVSFTSPLLFYSRHLYPEIPAALVSLLVVKAIRKNGSLSWLRLLLMGLGIGVLPWLGQKFLPLSFILIFISLIYLWRNKVLLSSKLLFILSALILIGLFYFYLHALYGTFSPRSIMTGYLGEEVKTEWGKQYFMNWQLKPKVATFLSYFIDQKEGLLIYAPIYIFCFIGLYGLYRLNKKDFWLVAGLLGVYIGGHAYVHQSSGFSPPSRPLAAIIWIFALLIAAGFKICNSSFGKKLGKTLLFISFMIALLLTIYPDTLYQNIVKNTMAPSKLYSKLSSLYFDYTKMLPSLLDLDILGWKAIIFWLVISIAIIFCFFYICLKKKFIRKENEVDNYSISLVFTMIVLLVCIILFCLFPRINVNRLPYMEFIGNKGFKVYSLEGNAYGPELNGIWIKGEKEARLLLQCSSKIKNIRLEFQSPVSQSAKIGTADYLRSMEIDLYGNSTFILSLSEYFSYKKSWLYVVNIRPESGFYPRKIIPGSTDSRYLGVFVKLKPIPTIQKIGEQ
jgi:hypothetical protein